MRRQEGERILHELRPERSILLVWFFSKCLPTAFTAAFLIFWFFGFFGVVAGLATDQITVGMIAAAIAAPVALILSLMYIFYLRKTYLYYVTNMRCVFSGGILRRVERSVPYHKITDVEISATILDRLLGISSLRIFTPGSTGIRAWPFWGESAEIEFVGLKDSQSPAATVNEILATFKATGE